MYFEGLLAPACAPACTCPALRDGDPPRVALEAYPGLLALELIGRARTRTAASADRLIARKDIVDALEQGRRGSACA